LELIVFNVGESELFFARRMFSVRDEIDISMSSLFFNFMFRLVLFDKILRNLGQFICLKLGLGIVFAIELEYGLKQDHLGRLFVF